MKGHFFSRKTVRTKKTSQILEIISQKNNSQCLLMKTFTHIIHNIFLWHVLLSYCPEGPHGAIPKGNCLLSTPAPRGQGWWAGPRWSSSPGTEGFPSCYLGVQGEMVPVCQRFTSAVGPSSIDPGGPGTGKAEVNFTYRNVGSPPSDSRTTQLADAGGAPKITPSMAPHKLSTSQHSSA